MTYRSDMGYGAAKAGVPEIGNHIVVVLRDLIYVCSCRLVPHEAIALSINKWNIAEVSGVLLDVFAHVNRYVEPPVVEWLEWPTVGTDTKLVRFQRTALRAVPLLTLSSISKPYMSLVRDQW